MEIEARLREHKVVPLWTLPDKHGESFNLAKKRGKEHFVLLICAPGANPGPFLEQLAPSMAELQSLPARGLVVVGSEDEAGALPSPPYTVLIDVDGKVRSQYLPDGAAAGVFLLDRYADLYKQWIVQKAADLPGVEDVVGWMQAISAQCSI